MPLTAEREGDDTLNAIRHLRFGFSFMLMPAFLLSVAMIGHAGAETCWLFAILHLLVYPASNGYNTYFDRDKEAIGGLEKPPPVNRTLASLVQGLDLAALACTAWLFPRLLPGMLGYQLASRLYSYHRVRLKALPWLSFIMVGLFQGILVYAMVTYASPQPQRLDAAQAGVVFLYLIASYPVTQTYQIEEDTARGDRTVAATLGIAGSLALTGLLFSLYMGLALWAGLPHVEVLALASAPVLLAFGHTVYLFWKAGKIGYASIRRLVLLNWMSSVAYFSYCLYAGSIRWQ